ncbi:MAG: hypothetical protein QM788_00605 [Roseateles sp.]|uniref:esterase/lipase family protein n=1 Tax=Roseateles sp. TaxID=1971397 RepID=UPI0039E9BFAC
MPTPDAPFQPIIYVRGYAMTRGEIDDTTADPFCGFNLGSTMYRAVPDKQERPRKHVFESPVVRLVSEYGYQDVYEDGHDIVDPEWEADALGKPTGNRLGSRSIVIYRYYDAASSTLGSGRTPSIEDFARGLSRLVARVRDLVCANPANGIAPADFRCYLVAHSMGGLVCRAFLQNAALDTEGTARHVDKFFTYATPHNGIDVLGHNIPSWLSLNDIDNFDRDRRMPAYLDLAAAAQRHHRVDLIPEARFPARRVFTLVGTNRLDYEAAAGAARTFVGHGSDGLVKIANATLHGLDAANNITEPCAKAFVYRAHSGHFGIVNSEEGFQNLTRFLFGDVRVDLWLEIDDIRLPDAVQKAADAGRAVNALYQIELLASPRGKLWSLTRRTAEEDSVACVAHADWQNDRSQYLSTVFLANWGRVNKRRRSLAYGMTVGVRAPDYEIERRLWLNEHFEGGYLFRNALILEMVPPADGSGSDAWKVKYAWQDAGVAMADTEITPTQLQAGRIEVSVPFDSGTLGANGKLRPTHPGIRGRLRFVIEGWNLD